MIAYLCDSADCNTFMTDLEDAVLVIIESEELHFCCGWCMIRWGANIFEPTEVIE